MCRDIGPRTGGLTQFLLVGSCHRAYWRFVTLASSYMREMAFIVKGRNRKVNLVMKMHFLCSQSFSLQPLQ